MTGGWATRRRWTASLADDNAFATFVSTLMFSGADTLAKAQQPTFPRRSI